MMMNTSRYKLPYLGISLKVLGRLGVFLMLGSYGICFAGPDDLNFSNDPHMIYEQNKTYTDKPTDVESKTELAKILTYLRTLGDKKTKKSDQKKYQEDQKIYESKVNLLTTRIYYLNDRVLFKDFSRPLMLKFLAMNAGDDYVQHFTHFWYSLAIAHVVEASYKEGISYKTIVELVQNFPEDAVHYVPFSATASATEFTYDVFFQRWRTGYAYFSRRSLYDAVQRKLSESVQKEIANPAFPASKRIALTEAFERTSSFSGEGSYGFVKSQMALLVATMVNIAIFQKNLTAQQVIDQALISQTGFLTAQLFIRKGIMQGMVYTLKMIELQRDVKEIESGIKLLKANPTVVSVLATAAEFVVCDLIIDHAIMPVVKSSQAYGQLYEAMFRLDSALRGTTLGGMTTSAKDPCKTGNDPKDHTPGDVECYKSQVKSGFQNYLKTIVFSDIQDIRDKSIAEQTKIDDQYNAGLMTKRFAAAYQKQAEDKLSQLSFIGVTDENANQYQDASQWKLGLVTQRNLQNYDNQLNVIWQKYLKDAQKSYVQHYQTIDSVIVNATKKVDQLSTTRERLDKCIPIVKRMLKNYNTDFEPQYADCIAYIENVAVSQSNPTQKINLLHSFVAMSDDDKRALIGRAEKMNEKLYVDALDEIEKLIQSVDLGNRVDEYNSIWLRRLKIDLPMVTTPGGAPMLPWNHILMGKITKFSVSYGDIMKSLLTGMKMMGDHGKNTLQDDSMAAAIEDAKIDLFGLIQEEIMRKNVFVRKEQPESGLMSLAIQQEGMWVKYKNSINTSSGKMNLDEFKKMMDQVKQDRKTKSPWDDSWSKNWMYDNSVKADNTSSIVITEDQFKKDNRSFDKSLRLMIYQLAEIQKCESELIDKAGVMIRDDNLGYDQGYNKLRYAFAGKYGYVLKRYYEESRPADIYHYEMLKNIPDFPLPVTDQEYIVTDKDKLILDPTKKNITFVDPNKGINIQLFIVKTTPRLSDDYMFQMQKQVGVSYEDLQKIHPLIECPAK